ncbi:GTPase Era, mitochondrial-like protein, partial [Euroglyphus maynei]
MSFSLIKIPVAKNFFVHPFYLTRSTTITCSSNHRNVHYERNIPKTLDEFKQFQYKPDEQPENARSLRVAIIGCPNVGKSTLLNHLINWKISAVSSKVHTTRKNVIGIYVENNTQLEFIDTPGLVSRKHMIRHKLELSFINDLKISVQNADIITILADVSNRRERSKLNLGILDLLQQQYQNDENKESILVLNKVDKIRDKRSLLDIVSTLTTGIVNGQPVCKSNVKDEMLKAELEHGKFE